MEELWRRDRVLLDQLLHRHPDWTAPQLAREVGRSVSWVKIGRRRLAETDPKDHNRFCSRSRAHHAPYHRWDHRVEDRITTMRESPPEHLHRTPGPKALLNSIPRDAELQALQVLFPRSTRTMWKILIDWRIRGDHRASA